MSNIKALIDIGISLTDQQKLPYHNSTHLKEMMIGLNKKEFDFLTELDKEDLRIAIAYHDSVIYYSNIKGLNEALSATMFMHIACDKKLYFGDDGRFEEIADLITVTQYHLDYNRDFSTKEKCMLDLDMINLSSSYDNFKENTRKIIFEKQSYMTFKKAKEEVNSFFNNCLFNFRYLILPEKYTNIALDNIKTYMETQDFVDV